MPKVSLTCRNTTDFGSLPPAAKTSFWLAKASREDHRRGREVAEHELVALLGDRRRRGDIDDERNALLLGDLGDRGALAGVEGAEQKGIPFVINIAAAPPITEQGYKFVFRNFPTAPMILGDAFANQKEIFEAAGTAPKSVVFMHVNDTFGTAMQKRHRRA